MVEATLPRSLGVVHSSAAMTPPGMNSFGSAAWLLIGGLGESFHPCCFNDNHGGAGGKCWGGGGVSCFSHSAMQRVSLHPPPAVNQSQCLFNYWDQRGPFTSSSSLSLVQSLMFLLPPPLLYFPLHSSLFSGCSICLNSAVSFLRT